MSVYDFEAKKIDGEVVSLNVFKGDVLLIVNTASKCGFTPQYDDLQSLYQKYKDKGLTVLGFPCNQFLGQEPGDELEIDSFCRLNYGVTFPMFAKVDVKGKEAHPLFEYLTENAPGVMGSKAIKWNFTKFLVDKEGNVVRRYAPQTKPFEIENDIKELLKL
ncbi:glutathione peroxidase [Peribacillus glennii]|uniref:Glutathione peroxidase n=1 Tax=Peribacillus glennii TaxID=2303991 RepID=A0A372LIK2_9BACI|nr:glutathione peroxidase [Peribacillus glennii]RFU65466.1 glutathione peroxidase [Peribacillus glennii]